jgi:hypothetical protein
VHIALGASCVVQQGDNFAAWRCGSASKNPDGSLNPFYLKRAFKYQPSDRFELEIVNSAAPYGAVPGHLVLTEAHCGMLFDKQKETVALRCK